MVYSEITKSKDRELNTVFTVDFFDFKGYHLENFTEHFYSESHAQMYANEQQKLFDIVEEKYMKG